MATYYPNTAKANPIANAIMFLALFVLVALLIYRFVTYKEYMTPLAFLNGWLMSGWWCVIAAWLTFIASANSASEYSDEFDPDPDAPGWVLLVFIGSLVVAAIATIWMVAYEIYIRWPLISF